MSITFQKRQKERKRQEKQREKAEKRAQKRVTRRTAKESNGTEAPTIPMSCTDAEMAETNSEQ